MASVNKSMAFCSLPSFRASVAAAFFKHLPDPSSPQSSLHFHLPFPERHQRLVQSPSLSISRSLSSLDGFVCLFVFLHLLIMFFLPWYFLPI